MDWNIIPDEYDRAARLMPALVTMLAPAVSLFIWAPASYEIAGVAVSVIVTFGGLQLLMHLARTAGRRTQKQLYAEWGGAPTTLWLRQSSPFLPAPTRQRYLDKLAVHVPNWSLPDVDSETQNPTANDDAYAAAVGWLRTHMNHHRDMAPAIYRENKSYGFRRNLRGLRGLGMVISVMTLVIDVVLLIAHISAPDPLLAYAAAGLSGVMVLTFGFVVTDAWVRDAADAYAQALLESCDLL